MNKLIISRLFESFTELDKAIRTAKIALGRKKNPPKDLLDRIESYEQILTKQRALAGELCRYVTEGNWDEVARHVSLINSLSSMIRDDAREVVAGIRPLFTPEERESMFT